MGWLSEAIEALQSLFGLLAESDLSLWLFLSGLLLIVVALVAIWKAAPRGVTFLLIGFGIIFLVAGPAVSLLELAREQPQEAGRATIPAKQVMQRLRVNAEVRWLARLIPFDPSKHPELSIDRITHLGRSDQRFTFVADYAELRGYRVIDAVAKVGGSLRNAERVSAILFPLDGRQLYPANARGLLQVVEAIDRTRGESDQSYQAFGVEDRLNKEERDDLKVLDERNSWAFSRYGQKFGHYCRLAQEFRCDEKFSARALIGDLSRDWHPLGLSQQKLPASDPCRNDPEKQCEIHSWEDTHKLAPSVGARAFLIENLELSTLAGRMLIDFSAPDQQRIPDLGF
jgi:hypothetical protein